MFHSNHGLSDESPNSDVISQTLRKLASHMDNSAGAYLLIESLELLNKKIDCMNGTSSASSVKLGNTGGVSSGGLVDPFAIQTEAAP